MRTIGVCFVTASLLVLGGCSLLDRTSSSENVKTAYAGTSTMTESQIEQLLRNQGYTHVMGLHRNGDDWLGSARDSSGTHVNFDIDKDGVIHTK